MKTYEIEYYQNTPDGYDNRYEIVKGDYTRIEAIEIAKQRRRFGKCFVIINEY